MLKVLLPGLAALMASAVFATAAQAVSLDYCQTSLRGGGSLDPGDELKQVWDSYQAKGWRPVSSWWRGVDGRSGEDFVWTDRTYLFASGYSTVYRFYCWDQRPGGWIYHDEPWYAL